MIAVPAHGYVGSVLNGSHVGPVVLDGLGELLAGALVGQILLHLHAELGIVIIGVVVVARDGQAGVSILLKNLREFLLASRAFCLVKFVVEQHRTTGLRPLPESALAAVNHRLPDTGAVRPDFKEVKE